MTQQATDPLSTITQDVVYSWLIAGGNPDQILYWIDCYRQDEENHDAEMREQQEREEHSRRQWAEFAEEERKREERRNGH